MDTEGSGEEMVMRTNDEATECRWSAIQAGLLDGNVELEHLEKLLNKHPKRKQPIINRGTFIRTIWIDEQIQKLVEQSPLDIIILGAGYDLRTLRMDLKNVTEIDFVDVINRKRKLTRNYPASLIGADFNDRGLFDRIEAKSSGVILLAECVLPYVERACIKSILEDICKTKWNEIHIILFEPIVSSGNAFGALMLQNVPANMPGVFTSEEELITFYNEFGFIEESSCDMDEAIRKLSLDSQQKLKRLGGLDEYEEWKLMSSHYYFFHFSHKKKPLLPF